MNKLQPQFPSRSMVHTVQTATAVLLRGSGDMLRERSDALKRLGARDIEDLTQGFGTSQERLI